MWRFHTVLFSIFFILKNGEGFSNNEVEGMPRFLVEEINQAETSKTVEYNADRDTHLTIGTPYALTCVSCSSKNVSWLFPQDCSDISQETSEENTEKISFSCTRTGAKRLTAVDSANESYDFDFSVFDQIGECMEWQLCIVDGGDCFSGRNIVQQPENRIHFPIRIWISQEYDPSNALDNQITRELYNLGEKPSLSLETRPFFNLPYLVSHLVFDDELNYWEGNLTVDMNEFPGQTLTITIKGSSVSLSGCYTKDTSITLDFGKLKYILEKTNNLHSRIDKYREEDLGLNEDFLFDDFEQNSVKALIDPCSSNVAYIEINAFNEIAISQNMNTNTSFFIAKPHSGDLLSIAPTRKGLFLLTTQGLQFLSSENGLKSSADGSDLSKLNKLSSSSSCDGMLNSEGVSKSDTVCAWDSSLDGTDSFFVTSDFGATFIPYTIGLPSDVRVYQVTPLLGAPKDFILLVDYSSSRQILFKKIGDVGRKESTSFGYKFDGSDNEFNDLPIELLTPTVASGEMFAWGGKTLWYSANQGVRFRPIHFLVRKSGDSTSYKAESGKIVQVVTNLRGDFAVLTNTNQIFWGKIGLSHAWEMYSPLPIDCLFPMCIINFQPNGQLTALKMVKGYKESVSAIKMNVLVSNLLFTQNVDAGEEIVPVVSNQTNFEDLFYYDKCPFLQIKWKELSKVDESCQSSYKSGSAHISQPDTFYLDNRESVELSVSMLHTDMGKKFTKDESRISATISHLDIVEVESYNEITTTNYLLNLVESVRRVLIRSKERNTLATSIGSTFVQFSSTKIGRMCPEHKEIIQVHTGCPPGRHLRIRLEARVGRGAMPEGCEKYECYCNSFKNKEYDLLDLGFDEGGTLRDSFEYDFDHFGCPIAVPYTDEFKPVLEIWDNDGLVREVSEDFVIFEANGRNDYSFTKTARASGCVIPPNVWANMNITKGKDAWTSENHIDCFEKKEVTFDDALLDLRYEVLRRDSDNYVRFSKSTKNAPLLFYATVVDPQSSFCKLQVAFAVHVYGLPLDNYMTLLIVSTTTACFIGLLIASYYWYRNDMGRLMNKN